MISMYVSKDEVTNITKLLSKYNRETTDCSIVLRLLSRTSFVFAAFFRFRTIAYNSVRVYYSLYDS